MRRRRPPRTFRVSPTPTHVDCKKCGARTAVQDMHASLVRRWMMVCRGCWKAYVQARPSYVKFSNRLKHSLRRTLPAICMRMELGSELVERIRMEAKAFNDTDYEVMQSKIDAAFTVDGTLRSAARGSDVDVMPVNQRNPLVYMFVNWSSVLLPVQCSQPAPHGLKPVNMMVLTSREAGKWMARARAHDPATLAFVREAWGRV
jgi:hypothetical protein